MKYIIGIDIGTSGTKSVLFDSSGNVVAAATEEYPLYQPENGWAEQDPADWWSAVCSTLQRVTAQAYDGEICAVGLTGQMHGLVMLDENNEVLRNAILWCDGRTTEECREIEELVGHDRLIRCSANPALEGFTASKIRWVQKHEPEHYKRCRHILLPKDYIRYRLTGAFATDVSDASGMQLLDVPERQWSTELCGLFGVDMSLLPKVHESAEITGYITNEADAATGLKSGTVVAGGAGDNAAAAIGTGVCESGKAFTTIGTSGVVFAQTDKPVIDKKGRIHTFCCAVPGQWHVMGVTQAAGLSLNWFKKNIAETLTYQQIDALCEEIPIGAEKLLYLPYLMGERTPILDADARGVFFGLSAIHTKAHLARAVTEGVTYSLYSCLEVLQEMNVPAEDMAVCGGGGKSAFWRKMLADMYDMRVKKLKNEEGPALGAAILAGCACGLYASVHAGCETAVQTADFTEPEAERHEQYMKYYAVYKALYPAFKEPFQLLKKV